MKKTDQVRDWVFRQVHTKSLVYNTCWEDPRCDRQLLELDQDSEVVMITSAGCNAMDYLLDQPKAIFCVDVNPRQNALLEFKKAIFQKASFQDLWITFGLGAREDAREFYEDALRPALTGFTRTYWDENIKYFSPRGIRNSFYHHGASGAFAWLANQYLRSRKSIYRKIEALFECKTLEEQSAIYNSIEPKVFNKIIQFFVNRHLTMCLVGVPRAQQNLFTEKYERGALGFIQECLRKVFTERPIHDNYFWRLYLQGAYNEQCRPEYLKPESFQPIRERASRVHTNSCTISQFLKENPGQYSHFILLDHQDWLAANNVPALEEEWRLILQNSRPGAKILLRSAAHQVDFFPDFAKERLIFEQEKTVSTHQQDRVGTYASVYLAEVI